MHTAMAKSRFGLGAALGLALACGAMAQVPQAPASASPAEDGNWRMPARDLASTLCV